MKVLIVDDDLVDSEFLARLLRKAGLETACLTGPQNLLDKLSENKFDCIFLDNQLGVAEGLGVLKELREAGSDIPIVLLSGHVDFRLQTEALVLGANYVLSKGDLSRDSIVSILKQLNFL